MCLWWEFDVDSYSKIIFWHRPLLPLVCLICVVCVRFFTYNVNSRGWVLIWMCDVYGSLPRATHLHHAPVFHLNIGLDPLIICICNADWYTCTMHAPSSHTLMEAELKSTCLPISHPTYPLPTPIHIDMYCKVNFVKRIHFFQKINKKKKEHGYSVELLQVSHLETGSLSSHPWNEPTI